jgi:hypothetical protein
MRNTGEINLNGFSARVSPHLYALLVRENLFHFLHHTVVRTFSPHDPKNDMHHTHSLYHIPYEEEEPKKQWNQLNCCKPNITLL